MDRHLKIEKVSWKTRGVFTTNREWVNVAPEIDLKDFRIGETYRVEVSQQLDGKWMIHKIIK